MVIKSIWHVMNLFGMILVCAKRSIESGQFTEPLHSLAKLTNLPPSSSSCSKEIPLHLQSSELQSTQGIRWLE